MNPTGLPELFQQPRDLNNSQEVGILIFFELFFCFCFFLKFSKNSNCSSFSYFLLFFLSFRCLNPWHVGFVPRPSGGSRESALKILKF